MLCTVLTSASAAIFGPPLFALLSGNKDKAPPPAEAAPVAAGSASANISGNAPLPCTPASPPPVTAPKRRLRRSRTAKAASVLFIGDVFPAFESKWMEFKVAQGTNYHYRRFFDRYAAAFMNASGGELFLGLADDGRIVGIKCDRERFDDLCLSFDQIARRGVQPPIDPEFYQVDLVDLYLRGKDGQGPVKSDRSLLRITFRCNPNDRVVYESDNWGYVIRGSASVQTMPPGMVADRQKFGRARAPAFLPLPKLESVPKIAPLPSKAATRSSKPKVANGKRPDVPAKKKPGRRVPPRQVPAQCSTTLTFPQNIQEYEAGQRSASAAAAQPVRCPSHCRSNKA